MNLERQGHLKQAEAKQLVSLIGYKKLVVGSDSWSKKMRTVYALNAEADELFKRAMRFKEEALDMEKGTGQGKRGREERAEGRTKRCRM
jgi:hypothetical protein